jgi:tRNA/rRNA methyltransferase
MVSTARRSRDDSSSGLPPEECSVSDPAVLDRIRIVLCQPSHPGNIGAVARAMKTMGFDRLALVAPRLFPHPDADARASGAASVLQAARVVDHLDEALAGTRFACALSGRRRDLTPEPIDVRSAAEEIVGHARTGEVAIVFGPERVGLGVTDVSRCHRLVRIPANPEYASLNLAAAVQIVTYEVRRAWAAGEATAPQGTAVQPASHEEVERMIVHLEETMRATGFLEPSRPGRLIQRMRRMFARARPESE